MLKESRTKNKSIIISVSILATSLCLMIATLQNGKSISKSDVGSLKNYFYKLSSNQDTVTFKSKPIAINSA